VDSTSHQPDNISTGTQVVSRVEIRGVDNSLAHRDRLLAVKRGEQPWQEVNAWRRELHRDCERALAESKLPERPDYEAANRFLVKARRGMATPDLRYWATRHHSHHYIGFAETQWKLFLEESKKRVKPLLDVYRVLLVGIHLMPTGEVEANLVNFDEQFHLPYIPELVARKLAGPEKSRLAKADLPFHEGEYQRLRAELQSAHESCQLPEAPSEATRTALNDLLVRLRIKGLPKHA